MKRLLLPILFLFWVRVFPCERAKPATVKANMHSFKTMVETYAMHHGVYPENVRTLQKAAKSGDYWNSFPNPMSLYQRGYGKSYLDLTPDMLDSERQELITPRSQYFLGLRVIPSTITDYRPHEGLVLYQYLSEASYRIYATGKDGILIHTDKKPFYLREEEGASLP